MVWLTKRLSKFTTFYEIEIDSILSNDYLSGLVGWERFARDNQYLQPLQGATTMTLTSHSIALSCVSRLVSSRWMLLSPSREYQWGKYHNTIDLLFDWFWISFMTTDNLCFYLQNRLIQTSQTGGQCDTSPFSIPWVDEQTDRDRLRSEGTHTEGECSVKLTPSAFAVLDSCFWHWQKY